jgi:hypothetical protein
VIPGDGGGTGKAKKPHASPSPYYTVQAPHVDVGPAIDYGPTIKSLLAVAKNAAPAPGLLASQATALAKNDVDNQLGALYGQKNYEYQRGAEQASLVRQASQAAANELKPLAGQTQASYTDAANTLAGFGQAYGSQLQGAATGEAGTVQRTLDALGGGQTTGSQAGNLGQVLSGLGGLLPAASFTQTGANIAAGQRELPSAVIGAGNVQATGMLGAARTAAEAYNPQIATAIGSIPGLTQKYLTSLQEQAATNRQNAMTNLFKAMDLQQQGDTAAASAAFKNANLYMDAAKANQSTFTHLQDQEAARKWKEFTFKNAESWRQLQYASSQEHRDEMERLAGVRENRLSAADQRAQTSALGYVVDKKGNPHLLPGYVWGETGPITSAEAHARGYRLDEKTGRKILYPGFKQLRDGSVVPRSTAKKKGGLTSLQKKNVAVTARTIAHDSFYGKLPKPTKDALGRLQFPGMVRHNGEWQLYDENGDVLPGADPAAFQAAGGISPGTPYNDTLQSILTQTGGVLSPQQIDAIMREIVGNQYWPGEVGRGVATYGGH